MPGIRPRRASTPKALVLIATLLLGACSGDDAPAEGEVGSGEIALTVPEGWVDRGDEFDEFVVFFDAPGAAYGRLGILRVEGLNSTEAYIMDTSQAGAGLRGLEPEVLERESVDVDGALEAMEIEFASSPPLEEELRIRTLQRAIRRTDDLGFDVRVEMAEDAWDADLARQVIDSVRLIDPPS